MTSLAYCIVVAPGGVEAWRFCARLPGWQRFWGVWEGSEQSARLAALEFARRQGRVLVEVQGVNVNRHD